MKAKFLFACLLLAAIAATAQPDKKTAPALHNFLNTEFMLKFRDLRIQCESNALQVQGADMNVDPQVMFRLRAAYDQTATRSNQLLENIKQDFLNDKKLKSIAEFPEMYSDGLRFKLQEISDYYNTHFMQALADAAPNQDEVDGGPALLLLLELVGLVNGLTRHFSEIRREARFYNDKYLQDNLVKPYRWQYWDELSGGNSRYEQFDRQPELIRSDAARQDQIEQRLQRVNETMNQVKNNNSNQTNDIPQDVPSDWQYTPDTPPADSTGTDPSNWSPYGSKQKTPQDPTDKKKDPTAAGQLKKMEEVKKKKDQ